MAYGTQSAGQDTYATVIAEASNHARYRFINARTKRAPDGTRYDALLTWDGGKTEVRIDGDTDTVVFKLPGAVQGPIQPKNATAGQQYYYLTVNAW